MLLLHPQQGSICPPSQPHACMHAGCLRFVWHQICSLSVLLQGLGSLCLASAGPVALWDYMLHHSTPFNLLAAVCMRLRLVQGTVAAHRSPSLLRPRQALALLLNSTLQALQRTCFTSAACDSLTHSTLSSQGSYKAWPPPAAEDSQWRCGNTCCTSCWCKARRAGQPIRSRQPRRRRAAAPAPAGPGGGVAMGAAAAAAVESGAGCAARAAAGWAESGPAAVLLEAAADMGAAGVARPAAAQADMVSGWEPLPCICFPARAVRRLLLMTVWGLGCPRQQQGLLTGAPTVLLHFSGQVR